MDPIIFEKGQHFYIVAPVAPITPGESEIEHFAFAEQLKQMAPNEHLMWLRGNYVEADNPNANGHVFTAGELQIKKLTPMFMPVTVMHDPRTAVGLIADVGLKLPEKDQVPRSKIETALALWKHRFPEVCEEAQHNYNEGSLMQSMECRSPFYTCCACGQQFPKLLDGSERANWCAHMRESDGHAARILGNVVYTGTGLIFGTRGARGAYSEAHLDVFQEEVAEFHDKAKRDSAKRPRRKTRMENVEVPRDEYAELTARPKKDEFDAEKKRADDAEQAKAEAEAKVEEAEAKVTKAEQERDEAKQKVEDADAAKAKDDLGKDRLGKLGKGFKAKLGEFTRGRVEEQAKSLSEEDWEARLKELEETLDVTRDEGGSEESGSEKGGEGEETVSREETARARVGSGGNGNSGTGEEPSAEQRQSVMRGLIPKPESAGAAQS